MPSSFQKGLFVIPRVGVERLVFGRVDQQVDSPSHEGGFGYAQRLPALFEEPHLGGTDVELLADETSHPMSLLVHVG